MKIAIWTLPKEKQFDCGNIDSHKPLLEHFTMFMYGFPHLERLQVVYTSAGIAPPATSLKLYRAVLLASLRALVALLHSPAARRLSSLWLSLPFWFTLDYLEQSCLAIHERTGRTLQAAIPKLTDLRLDIQSLNESHQFDELSLVGSRSDIGIVFLSQMVQCDVLHLSCVFPYLIPGNHLLAFRRLKELSLEEIDMGAEDLVAIVKYNKRDAFQSSSLCHRPFWRKLGRSFRCPENASKVDKLRTWILWIRFRRHWWGSRGLR